jgi:uncharacterized membrane protein
MPRSGDLFDMRRLEVLSNTIFGVAMTLLASRIPTAPFQNGAPTWPTIWAAYHSQIAALLISFVVAGMFWFGHQRRLAYAPQASRWVVYLNLLFLLTVIVLPVTAGLYGMYGTAPEVVVLYSSHLALMSGLNAVLWLLASLPRGEPDRAVGSIFATVIFVTATLVALVTSRMFIVQFMWCGAFATPIIEAIMDARRRG